MRVLVGSHAAALSKGVAAPVAALRAAPARGHIAVLRLPNQPQPSPWKDAN
ncbi:hypothetical protein [Streptomyces sp. NPDC002952]|uniref:hypothetical protein n=1 Tax=Streptomyces sp. NPDC002952 TaxID=3364673 RepID=UPI0036749DE6